MARGGRGRSDLSQRSIPLDRVSSQDDPLGRQIAPPASPFERFYLPQSLTAILSA